MADESIPQKNPYSRRACWPLPESKRCAKCDTVQDACNFQVREYKTSTGRDSRKLHSMCHPCRLKHNYSKFKPKGTPKGKPAHPIDQPKQCRSCKEIKGPECFYILTRYLGRKYLSTNCSECLRKKEYSLEKRREYDLKRRRKEDADPERLAKKKAWHAENFQENKERIRLRNMQRRRDRPDIVRARAIASAIRRSSFGDNRRIPEIKKAVADALDSYRIGDMYWDVYESKLIEVPTVDHIDPISRGGLNVFENLTVTGLATNSSKGSLPLIVWMAKRAAREAAKKKL